MEAFVLDASVALSWCFPNDPTEDTLYSREVLQRLEQVNAVGPEIWALEIANGVFIAFAKRKRIAAARIREYLELLRSLPIRVEHREWLDNVALEALARKHNLPAYDIAYVDLAMRLDLPLATSDQALKRAALVEGVKLL